MKGHIGASLALTFSLVAPALAEKPVCPELVENEESPISFAAQKGRKILLPKGTPLTAMYGDGLDLDTFRATLDGKDVTHLFMVDRKQPANRIAVFANEGEQLLQVSVRFEADYEDRPWVGCMPPPLHQNQWVISEWKVRPSFGAEVTVGNGDEPEGVLMQEVDGRRQFAPVGEY